MQLNATIKAAFVVNEFQNQTSYQKQTSYSLVPNLKHKMAEGSNGPGPGHLLRSGSLGMWGEPKFSDICGRWRPLLSNKTTRRESLYQQCRRSDIARPQNESL